MLTKQELDARIEERVAQILDVKAIEKALTDNHADLKAFMEKAEGELEEAGKVSSETRDAVKSITETQIELSDRLQDVEQRAAQAPDGEPEETLGEQFTKLEGYEDLADNRRKSLSMNVKTALISPLPSADQPLVPADRRPGIVHAPQRLLTIRDLIPVGRTSSNNVEFARETTFTNAAAAVVGGSPEAYENVQKPESAFAFALANEPVRTVAHHLPASRQILSDAPMLQSYLNGRLLYGLKLVEETQLLNGTGANGQLNGIVTQKTSYTMASPLTYSTKLDVLRDAIKQAQGSEYQPDGIVLNPVDWAAIELSKDSQGRYLFANPQTAAQPRLWGLPVVVTNSMTSGDFLVGCFATCAQIWDREDATIEASREHSDNFTKNMVTLLAEERICITVYNTGGFIGETFPA